jgi:hypothetical protein
MGPSGYQRESDILIILEQLTMMSSRDLSIAALVEALGWDGARVTKALTGLASEGLTFWAEEYDRSDCTFPRGAELFVGQFAPLHLPLY